MQSGLLIHCPHLGSPFLCTCGYLQRQVHITPRSLFHLLPLHILPYFGYFGLFSYTSWGLTHTPNNNTCEFSINMWCPVHIFASCMAVKQVLVRTSLWDVQCFTTGCTVLHHVMYDTSIALKYQNSSVVLDILVWIASLIWILATKIHIDYKYRTKHLSLQGWTNIEFKQFHIFLHTLNGL